MNKPRILVLTPRFPYPAVGGDKIRILHICRALANDFELSLLSLCESREQMRFLVNDEIFQTVNRIYFPRWRSWINSALALLTGTPLQLAYYDSSAFREAVRRLQPLHHLTIAHLIRTGQYVEAPNGKCILEMTDAISLNYERTRDLAGHRSMKQFIYRVEQGRLKHYELRTVRSFDTVWLTSRTDRNYLDPLHARPIQVIPNGVDPEALPFSPPRPDAHVIVFIGNMESLQNQDACHYFLHEIFPAIRKRAAVRFRIVGNAPCAVAARFRGYAGVDVTGRVTQIQDGTHDAFCGVAPLRAGAGIQNKILEYMALGLPCVTSPIGLGGIDAVSGRDLLVYRSADQAAEQILMLYQNQNLRTRFAYAGRSLVEQNYNWNMIYRQFVTSCRELLSQPANRRAGTEFFGR